MGVWEWVKIQAIQESNRVWASEPHKILLTVYNFPTLWDRLDYRKGLLCFFFPWLITSLAFGHSSLGMGPVASDLFSYHSR